MCVCVCVCVCHVCVVGGGEGGGLIWKGQRAMYNQYSYMVQIQVMISEAYSPCLYITRVVALTKEMAAICVRYLASTYVI